MVLSVSVFTWPVLRPFRLLDWNLFVLVFGLVLSNLDNGIALYATQSSLTFKVSK